MTKRLIGLTGPSAFLQECIDMVEDFYQDDFVMLYQNNTDSLLKWVDRCDAIILAGGLDIHPSVYDQSIWNGQNLSKFDLRRDIRELKVIDRCKETRKSFFGICRGLQLIGITYGFWLIPDLAGSSICHQPQRSQISLEKHEPVHAVDLVNEEAYFSVFQGRDPSERMCFRRIMGHDQNTKLWTNSFHHQGLAYPSSMSKIPEGVTVYGTARVDLSFGPKNEVKKIIELMGGDYWVACQWHPEYDWQVNSASRSVMERFKVIMDKSKNKTSVLIDK